MGTADSGFGSRATPGSLIRIRGQQERIRDVKVSNESMIHQVYISAVRLSLRFNYFCYFIIIL